MIVEIKVPSPGESITEVQLTNWLIADGDIVPKNQEIAEVESDKATLPLISSEAGKIKIIIAAGETIKVGSVACTIDTEFAAQVKTKTPPKKEAITPQVTEAKKEPIVEKQEPPHVTATSDESLKKIKITPVAQQMMEENNIKIDEIIAGIRKISKEDVQTFISSGNGKTSFKVKPESKGSRDEERLKMTNLRKKLSQRLVAVKNETAMLTTFNEVDMTETMSIRKRYQEEFQKKYGLKLGFMSFFTKAVTEALQLFPSVNSMIDRDEIIFHKFCDVCIAVQTDKGLMVPVVRNTESLTIPEIEIKIAELAAKARSNRISIEEMTGGTFTITNGGIYGSLMSTPIINPPQSAILGMHNIVERPVAINGKIEIRPMMYIALSYDHRAIDGKDSVSFLFKVKELLESPWKLYSHGEDIGRALLDL